MRPNRAKNLFNFYFVEEKSTSSHELNGFIAIKNGPKKAHFLSRNTIKYNQYVLLGAVYESEPNTYGTRRPTKVSISESS